jgi:hypothetical protein
MTAKSNTATAPAKRNRASVSYPYHQLALCLDLANAVKEIGNGKQEVSRTLLASHLKLGENSGDFSQKIASTKTYGLIDGRGAFRLTDLALGLFFPTTDPVLQKKIALLEAAAAPGAFEALLQRYDGSKLPSHELIGNVLSQQMGIPESWKVRVTTFFIKAMEVAGALGPDGFLRHAAELEKARLGSGGPDLSFKPASNVAGGNGTPPPPADEPDSPGVITWKYKALRVHTPDDMTREIWEKLKAYVDILEPSK